MKEIIMVAVAGAFGALGRWGLSRTLGLWLGGSFPLGTLAANLIGCFLLGLIMQIGLTTDRIPGPWRLALTVGFLGALTTFSTFSYETVALLQDASWLRGGLNIALNLIGGLAACLLGIAAARYLIGGGS